MPRDLRTAALHYLRSGAVTVLTASTPASGPRQPMFVEALVEGYRSTHRVRLALSKWSCSCRCDGCAHVAAVQLVTGHDTPARPTERSTHGAPQTARP
jgi:hypothetical protein